MALRADDRRVARTFHSRPFVPNQERSSAMGDKAPKDKEKKKKIDDKKKSASAKPAGSSDKSAKK